MAITQLNTKIKLRYDTLENWQDLTVEGKGGNLILLKGEVAFCEVPAATLANGTVDANGASTVDGVTANNMPTIIFKVGDGIHAFKDLNWGSALAADVYAWAKKAYAETGDGMRVTGFTAPVEGDGHADLTTKNNTTLNSVLQDIYDQFNTLNGGTGSIGDQIKAALAELVNTAAQQTSGTVNVTDATQKYVTGITIESDANGVKRLKLVERTLPTVVDADATIGSTMTDNDGDTVVTSVTQDKGEIIVTKQSLGLGSAARKNVAQSAIADDTTNTDLVTSTQVATYVQGKVDDYIDKVDILIDNDDNKSVRTIANEELAAQLIPANAQESLNTLKEIATWIQTHPGDASAMNDAITALKTHAGLVDNGASRLTKTVDVEGTPTVQQATVKEYVDNAIGEVDADITALQTKTELGTYDNNGTPTEYATVKAYVEAEINAVETDIAAMDYTIAAGAPASATDAAFTNVLTGFEIADGKLVTNSATTQTLAKVATTGKIEDLIQTEDFMILDGGNAEIPTQEP